jgi:Cys-tRNA(Pro)/Cys-tRNA(Cys) deacylase
VKLRKTNAARLLDKAGVPYETIPYTVDEEDLSALHLAGQLRQDVNRIFKTLVLHGDRTGHFVCLLPGGAELDLKKAAKLSGNKSCALIAMKDLQPLTGYLRGGCSPLGMKKTFPTFIHQSALEFPSIYVSAGLRGLQLLLAPGDLVAVTRALVADLVSASG